jgi:hypothetical protein
VLRVHDALHNNEWNDRYRKLFRVEPGFQTIRASLEDIRTGPQNRSLDMKRIAGFALFTINLERSITFYIGDVRLVN